MSLRENFPLPATRRPWAVTCPGACSALSLYLPVFRVNVFPSILSKVTSELGFCFVLLCFSIVVNSWLWYIWSVSICCDSYSPWCSHFAILSQSEPLQVAPVPFWHDSTSQFPCFLLRQEVPGSFWTLFSKSHDSLLWEMAFKSGSWGGCWLPLSY